MNSGSSELYSGREQTLVKHFILEHYLERFAHIIGSGWDVITYVDGFSGPWNVQSGDLKDSSFYLALGQLRKARETHKHRGKDIRIRCLFLEREREPYEKLKAFTDTVKDAEVATRNAGFEDSIEDIVAFARAGGSRSQSFPFIFIDPTGWTGFAMDQIGPLLRLKPGEVLINFMTGHIRRFIESPDQETQESFERLFGSADYRERVTGLARQDREDQLVQAYSDAVKCVGEYKYVCPAIVLHPQINRTHFHLIYATRSPTGVEAFKQVEKKAMEVMEKTRADAQQRKRVQKTGQHEWPFAGEAMHDRSHYEALRDRYLGQSQERILGLLRSQSRVLFDAVWTEALSVPLVWDSDVKGWIQEWTKAGLVRIEGMGPRERVPKRGNNHWVVYAAHGNGTSP